jgi:hypothetical protein
MTTSSRTRTSISRRPTPTSSSTPRSNRSSRSAGRRWPALLVAVVVVLSACTATAPTPSAAPLALGPLKIGILVPFTESAIDSDIGASQRRAADL